jgi:hexokinase
MSLSKEHLDRFLASSRLEASSIDPEAVLEDFLEEMKRGLNGQTSSLVMIPTYISTDKPVPAGRPVIVVDAGGTNLRVATAVFDDNGVPTIEHFSNYVMPGAQDEVGKDEFFDLFAGYLLPVAGIADSVGLCFSYAAEITPDGDGRLLTWTKEIKAPEVIGELVGRNIAERLMARGFRPKITLLNDTVATLLAGKSIRGSERYDSYVGFILGTGTNTSYVEKNVNIGKHRDLDPAGAQAINVESGNFGKCPRGRIDLAFDRSTVTPGAYTFEKMISGAYLGGLCLLVLRTAAGEGLFSASAARDISSLQQLSTIEVDTFLRNPGRGQGHPLSSLPDEARGLVRSLFAAVIERAALLTAINISAAVLKSGGGRSPRRPVCINVDGSTYYKTIGLRPRTEDYLGRILTPRNISWQLIRVEDSPLIGAAVAGLTH